MLPAQLISTLKALALTDRPLITAVPATSAADTGKQFEPGQKLQALVQAQVAAHTFNVRVADQLLRMQLPAFVKVGDSITLQVASQQPRLAFALVNNPGTASSNAPPSSAVPASGTASTSESLSDTSRLLSSLSQQPLEKSYVRPLQSAPLWSGGQVMPDTTQLAGKLHEAISQSGLFYESHQAQWIAGTRPTAQLLQEPQSQLPQNPLPPSTDAVDGKTLPVRSGSEQPLAAPAMPEHVQTLVQQQLNALETRQVMWQGQVWPGQEMTWEVREESPRHGGAPDAEAGQWTTQISLDLPNLGGVSARLSFSGNALKLSLDVADAKTRDKLGSASSQLVAALSERGIPVTHTQITRHEHAG